VPNASAACWIPAFAGMTAVEGNGGRAKNKNAAPSGAAFEFVAIVVD
jgi:hypothetical protein